MGNCLSGKNKTTVKVMRIDGTAFRLKPPVAAGELIRDNPGHSVIDSAEVKSLGLGSRRLTAGDPLLPGRLYFLVQLPRRPALAPRRAYSGNLRVSAKDRLESLLLSRRAVSDLAHHRPTAAAEVSPDGGLRLRLRLPKSEVAMLVAESRDAADAAQKIVRLAASVRSPPAPSSPVAAPKQVKATHKYLPFL
ncbi:Uncharacterized protein AXF42_Ash013258 [Apostasia shenzhenica]|uniref:Uncharacterized protein n=1 Tax=Apostasia shenzhenica TaxID=1088818 RepID=A0A2I0BBG4_9ASPA|nr:Uncharacterized protein AXF42_Ash013258 [Apostasia shenzhenica]